jgi:hypothetical protein
LTREPVPESARHEVISVSLPRDLVRRANEVIPKSRRSRVIAAALEAFLDSVAARRVAEEYAAYYSQRPRRDARQELALLEEWKPADDEAWRMLDREARRGRRRPAR